MAKIITKTEIVTGEVRLSYCHLFTPQVAPNSLPGAKPKYSVCLLIPKDDTETLDAVKSAIKSALEAGAAKKFGGKTPKVWHNPLRDGDEERDLEKNPEYAGHYFINCNSTSKPTLVDRRGQEILDPFEINSGDYARANIQFYAYATSGNNGVACGINNVMKTRDGESLGGGKTSAASAFAGMFDDDDDLI